MYGSTTSNDDNDVEGEEQVKITSLRQDGSLSDVRKKSFYTMVLATVFLAVIVTLAVTLNNTRENESVTASITNSGNASSPFFGHGDRWQIYKWTMAGAHSESWAEKVQTYISEEVDEYELGCDGNKKSGNVGDIQIHIVQGSYLEESIEKHRTSYWQNISEEVFSSMEHFHTLMHNKIQILVPDIEPVDTEIRKNGDINAMRRFSNAPGDVTVAHLIMNIEAQLYELVSPVSDNLNTEGFVYWQEKECPIAHALSFDPTSIIEEMISLGSFQTKTAGGFTTGYWISMQTSTAYDMDSTTLKDDMQFLGLEVNTVNGEFCDVTSITGFGSKNSSTFLEPYRYVSYVRNRATSDSLKLVEVFEEAVSATHDQLYDGVTEHWGSNWDHWLDRHIGVSYNPTDNSEVAIVDGINILNQRLQVDYDRRVGLRLDGFSKFYVAWEGIMTYEFLFNNGWDKADWQQYHCSCIHSNNYADFIATYPDKDSCDL
jgi:hypothetical protein